jgi:hypothetical protein
VLAILQRFLLPICIVFSGSCEALLASILDASSISDGEDLHRVHPSSNCAAELRFTMPPFWVCVSSVVPRLAF